MNRIKHVLTAGSDEAGPSALVMRRSRVGTTPHWPLGRTGIQVSALGLGGHHLDDLQTVEEAIRLVHEAVDAGITFFDNCWEYWNGRAEDWLGRVLKGRRDQAFLMKRFAPKGATRTPP